MDNQATKHIKNFLTNNECKLQLVEPHNHRVNAAEHAIQTFKDAFIAVLATTDSNFPLQLWDRITPQVQDTLNLMRASRINPNISAYEALTARMTGINIVLYPWDARPSYTKMVIPKDHGRHGALMHGTLAHQRTTTDAPSITSLKPGCIAYQDQQNSFRNIANYLT
jgi:hypothetical protein